MCAFLKDVSVPAHKLLIRRILWTSGHRYLHFFTRNLITENRKIRGRIKSRELNALFLWPRLQRMRIDSWCSVVGVFTQPQLGRRWWQMTAPRDDRHFTLLHISLINTRGSHHQLSGAVQKSLNAPAFHWGVFSFLFLSGSSSSLPHTHSKTCFRMQLI